METIKTNSSIEVNHYHIIIHYLISVQLIKYGKYLPSSIPKMTSFFPLLTGYNQTHQKGSINSQ